MFQDIVLSPLCQQKCYDQHKYWGDDYSHVSSPTPQIIILGGRFDGLEIRLRPEHFVPILARNLISKSQKQNLPVAPPVLSNIESSVVQNVLTSRKLFSFILTFIKMVEIKAVCSKDSLTLLLRYSFLVA